MSRNKYTKAEINIVVGRALVLFGLKKEKDLAVLFGLSQQALSNRKNTGGIVNLIEKEAYKRNLNFHSILTGEGEMYIKNHVPPEAVKSEEKRESDLEKKVKQLESRLALVEMLLAQSQPNPVRH